MAVLQETLIWIAYAVALVVLMLVAAIFTYTYQKPGDRSASISTVTIISLTALLATILLLPVDIALVSATTSSKLGRRKDWASQAKVNNIVLTLKIIYYTLYSFDALLCLLIIPFSYFLYEEYDDVDYEDDEGHRRTAGDKILGAAKYTIAFVALIIILFLVGFFVPVAAQSGDHKKDLDYFKKLLSENKPEKALTFALGILITIGTILYIIYTAAGLALFPISLIKSAPSISAPTLAANTASELDENRERQRQLESRNTGNRDGLSSRDRRELEALARDERTLVRRQRLAADAGGEGKGTLVKIWTKTLAVLRPVKLLGGIFILLISILLWVSMLISGIDKAKNSTCKARCGYILGHSNIFNPIDWLFVKSAKVFPVDYVLVALLVFLFFSASIVGLASIGIRFLWLKIFQIRKGHTSAQALLMATVMLTLIVLAINYSLAMLVAPQYATFGPQTYCSLPPRHPGDQPNCDKHPEKILPCSELADSASAKAVCTPSVISTFLNRITLNFPYFGAVDFWGQFAFLLVFLVIFLLSLFRAPKLNVSQLDEDAEEEEEEGLLASTHRRFGATWEDITGRSKAKSTNKPTSGRGSRDPPDVAAED